MHNSPFFFETDIDWLIAGILIFNEPLLSRDYWIKVALIGWIAKTYVLDSFWDWSASKVNSGQEACTKCFAVH